MKEQIKKIEERLIKIEQRNKKVELEKAWETSTTRKISILLITYIFIVILMYFLDIKKSCINAIIPTIGYFISTQSLPFIKKCWVNKKRK